MPIVQSDRLPSPGQAQNENRGGIGAKKILCALLIIAAIGAATAGATGWLPATAMYSTAGVSTLGSVVLLALLSRRSTQKPEPANDVAGPAPDTNLLVEHARPIFAEVRQGLERIDRININPNALAEIRERLESIPEQLKVVPMPSADKSNNPLIPAAKEYLFLSLWIESIQHHYDYFKCAIREGEVAVPDNGDCLFEASLYHSEMNGSRQNNLQEERQLTVQWMRDNNENVVLRGHLATSLAEHYFAKIEHLEADRQGLAEIAGTEERRQQIGEEIQNIETQYIFPILSETTTPFLEEYFQEMSKQGIHGGAAELYALSCRHQVCVKIHAKRGEDITQDAHITMNPELESGERPARHFTHSRNHYNPYNTQN